MPSLFSAFHDPNQGPRFHFLSSDPSLCSLSPSFSISAFPPLSLCSSDQLPYPATCPRSCPTSMSAFLRCCLCCFLFHRSRRPAAGPRHVPVVGKVLPLSLSILKSAVNASRNGHCPPATTKTVVLSYSAMHSPLFFIIPAFWMDCSGRDESFRGRRQGLKSVVRQPTESEDDAERKEVGLENRGRPAPAVRALAK